MKRRHHCHSLMWFTLKQVQVNDHVHDSDTSILVLSHSCAPWVCSHTFKSQCTVRKTAPPTLAHIPTVSLAEHAASPNLLLALQV